MRQVFFLAVAALAVPCEALMHGVLSGLQFRNSHLSTWTDLQVPIHCILLRFSVLTSV